MWGIGNAVVGNFFKKKIISGGDGYSGPNTRS